MNKVSTSEALKCLCGLIKPVTQMAPRLWGACSYAILCECQRPCVPSHTQRHTLGELFVVWKSVQCEATHTDIVWPKFRSRERQRERGTWLKWSVQRAAWVVSKNNLCMWNEFQAGGREEEEALVQVQQASQHWYVNNTPGFVCASVCTYIVCAWERERESYLVDGRVWLPCARGRMELRGTDWLCTLIGCGQNVNDCSCLSRCQVLGTVSEEGWGVWDCVCGGESIGACERRQERKRERGGRRTERERKRTGACEEREGGSFRQRGWTTAQTLQSFFCFSEEAVFLFSLPVSPSCCFFSRCLAMTLVDTLISLPT